MRRGTLLVVALVLGLSLPAWAASVRVTVQGAPLRVKPEVSAEIMVRLERGAVLELLDVARDWYRVRDPQTKREGFILASLAELLPSDPGTGGTPAFRPGAVQPAGRPASGAAARTPRPGEWRDKGFISASGLFQGEGTAFAYSFSPAEYAYAEQARLTSHHTVEAGPAFDVAAGWRLWRNLAVGAAVSGFSKSADATVDGTVPHPLYLNRDRQVSGSFASNRRELGVHAQATWVIPAGRHLLIALAGGPSYLRVEQAVASGVDLSAIYPYDTTEFTGARTETRKKGALGFNAGVDVAYYPTRHVGVGGGVRFSRATVAISTLGGNVDTDAGGIQAAVGLRIRLGAPLPPGRGRGPAKAPPPPPPVRK